MSLSRAREIRAHFFRAFANHLEELVMNLSPQGDFSWSRLSQIFHDLQDTYRKRAEGLKREKGMIYRIPRHFIMLNPYPIEYEQIY